MTPLHTYLPNVDGSDLIQKCWGEVPNFDGPRDVLHVCQTLSSSQSHEILLTGIFMTTEFEDANKCKPSQMLIRFSDVVFWEYDYGCAQRNGVELAAVLIAPPTGYLSFDADGFHIVCRKVTILSCQQRPFPDFNDETVAV